MTFDLVDGDMAGRRLPWMTDAERDAARVGALFVELSRDGRPRRPVEPSRRRPARSALAQRLAARGGRSARGDPRPARWRPEPLRRVGRAHVAPRRPPDGRGAGSLGEYDLDVWENETVTEGSATVALRMADELGDACGSARPCAGSRSDAGSRCSWRTARGWRATLSCARCPSGRYATSSVEGISPERLASLRRQRHARAGKAVVAYRIVLLARAGPERPVREREPVRVDLAAGRGRALDPRATRASAASPVGGGRGAAGRGAGCARADLRRARPRPGRLPAARLGRRSVDTRLRRPVGAGRRHGGRAAARNPRAPVLRRRVRPLGGGLHGGRGAHRPRREGDLAR